MVVMEGVGVLCGKNEGDKDVWRMEGIWMLWENVGDIDVLGVMEGMWM